MNPQSRFRTLAVMISLLAIVCLITAPAANAQTASRTFPSTALGNTSAPQTLTLSNAGIFPVSISSVAVSGDFAQTNNCGKSLAGRGSCTITVTFSPKATGTRTGVVTVKTSGGTVTANLSGTGIAPVTISAATLAFGSQSVGLATAAQSVTVHNAMSTTLSFSSIAISGDYSLTNGCGSSLAAGASCSLSVVFKPTVAGSRTGTLTITDNAVGSPSKVTLSGTGVAVTLKSIALTPANPSVAKGKTQQIIATGTYSNNTTADLTASATWTSNKTTVATVSNTAGSKGMSSAMAAGSATISAALSGVTGTTALTVPTTTLVSIAVTPATASIPKGKTQQYAAVGTYSDGTTQTLTSSVTWSSTTGATITAGGLATGSAVGTPTITATSGTIKGTASLTVNSAALVSITITPANASIAKGLTQQFTATGTYTDNTTQNLTSSVTWSSTSQASMTAGGLATGMAQGAATISAVSGTISGTVALNVLPAALSAISVSPAGASIPKGNTMQYSAMGTYTDASTGDVTASVTWSATTGASITASGMATGTAQGTPTITAKSGAISGSAVLNVLPPALTSIAVSPASASVPAGTTQQYVATGTYTDGSTQNLSGSVNWAVSAGDSISVTGLATGSVQGPATVSAASGSINGSASLTVVAPVLTAIAVSPANASVTKGSTQQFAAQGTYTDGSSQDVTASVNWSASSGATITAGGMATGTIVGVPVITAASGSISNSVALNVMPPAIASITVTPGSVSTGLNGQQQFAATATYVDGSTADVTNSVGWSSGNSSVVTVSGSGFAQAIATADTAIPIMATSGSVTSNPAWFSALSSLPMVCPNPTIDLKVLVVTNGQSEADFPAIKQILDYVGTPYTVFDMSENPDGITADMLSDGSCHAYYQGVIFAIGGYIYGLPGMSELTAFEKQFGIRQVNWFTWPGTDYGLNSPDSTVDSNSSVTANFTAAAAQVFSYANTNTPLTIANAAAYLSTPIAAPAGTTITPLLMDGSGHALSVIYDFGDGRQYLTQTFDSNQYLTHDLILAYGLVNWVTKGVFLGEYHVYAAASVDDFFINDAEWVPGTSCTNPITHDRTASDDPSLPTFRLKAADMTALSNWQNKLNQDPLLSNFKLSLAFNGVGTSGNNDWTGVSAPGVANDDLVSELQSYQQFFHWMSHTYDHPETLDGLCKSTGTGTGCGDAANIAAGFGGIDSVDLEVLTNLWVAGQTTGSTGIPGIANLDGDESDAGLQQLTFSDYDPHAMVTPGVTGLDDANVSQYLYQDGVFYVVSDTSVTPTATNNNGPNPSPNVGIVNIYAPIYEVPRHANDVYFNAANWNDDSAEFHCIYGPAGSNQAPYNNFTPAQILDYVSSSFVNNMLLGDMDPQMFHQPNLHAYDGTHSMIGDTYDMTFNKYEALYKLPVLSPTQAQTAQLMQARNNYNLSGVTASWVGGANPVITINVPASASIPSAVIPVTGLNSTGAEVYGGSSISHITVDAGQTVTVPAQ